MTLTLDVVATGLGFPEGPVIMNDGALLFVDIEKQTLSRLCPSGEVDVVASLGGGPNGVAIGPDGAAYVCNNGAAYGFVQMPYGGKTVTVPSPERPDFHGGCIQRVDLETGAVSVLYDACNGKKLLAPDDIVFDASGGFWFTETGIQDDDTLQKGGVYYCTTDGTSITKVATIDMANGIGLSPDGKVVYVADTIFGRLWALDIVGPGQVKPGPMPGMPGRVIQTLPGYQWVDSLKVEADGKICVGTIFNGGITVFDPDGTTEHVTVPDLFTTNLCFGGADMRDVWITASSSGTIYKARWPRAGLPMAFTA
ncbi:SMP-30/gluconolactonase/LRE family protein [Sulfitobacter sp. HNIBRBA2951]|uniref:SMP-30/gluconolactonase/LRE family protein n=1 Tax=Sulfitobacter aquimarinus TaxID=3158557 RepID=UPI0032DEDC44